MQDNKPMLKDRWRCSFCGQINPVNSTVCPVCTSRRSKSEKYRSRDGMRGRF